MASSQTERPTTERIDVDQRGGVAIVALNRPEARNAVDDALRHRFNELCHAHTDDFALTMYTNLMQNHLATPAGLHEWLRGRLHAAQRALEAGDVAAATQELATMQERMEV